MSVTLTPFTVTGLTPDTVAPTTFTPAGLTPDTVAPTPFTVTGLTPDSTAPTVFFSAGVNVATITIAKAFATVNLPTDGTIFLKVAGVSYTLNAGTTAESLPTVFHPTDYNASTNAKYWA